MFVRFVLQYLIYAAFMYTIWMSRKLKVIEFSKRSLLYGICPNLYIYIYNLKNKMHNFWQENKQEYMEE